MKYEEAKKQKALLNEQNEILSVKLKSFPTIEMGLVSDDVRKSVEYIKAKREFDKSFNELREFNSWFIKSFKKEYNEERRNRFK